MNKSLNTFIIILSMSLTVASLKLFHSQLDPFINQLIQQSRNPDGVASIDKATIISLNGDILVSPNTPHSLQITPTEASRIASAMNSGDFTQLQANGIHVQGVKYMFLSEDDYLVYAKAKGKGALTIQKSKSMVVIGHTKEGRRQSYSNISVHKLAFFFYNQEL